MSKRNIEQQIFIEALLRYENWRSQNNHKYYTNIEMIENYVNELTHRRIK